LLWHHCGRASWFFPSWSLANLFNLRSLKSGIRLNLLVPFLRLSTTPGGKGGNALQRRLGAQGSNLPKEVVGFVFVLGSVPPVLTTVEAGNGGDSCCDFTGTREPIPSPTKQKTQNKIITLCRLVFTNAGPHFHLFHG